MCKTCENYKFAIDFANKNGVKFKGLSNHYEEMLGSMTDFHKWETQSLVDMENNKIDVSPKKDSIKSSKIIENMLLNKDEYSEKVSQYPETVQNSVKLFAKTFSISSSAIPKKSKSKGGLYATWISGIQDLQSIARNEHRFKLVLDKVYNVWNNRSSEYKNNIDMPQKIRASFVTMEAELSQEELRFMKEEIEKTEQISKKETYVTDNEEVRNSALSDLKKLSRKLNNGI